MLKAPFLGWGGREWVIGIGWQVLDRNRGLTSNRALHALALRHAVEKAQVVKPKAIKTGPVAVRELKATKGQVQLGQYKVVKFGLIDMIEPDGNRDIRGVLRVVKENAPSWSPIWQGVPKSACRWMQALYLESVNGNVRVKDLIEQLANLDREQHDKMVFEDSEAGWREAT